MSGTKGRGLAAAGSRCGPEQDQKGQGRGGGRPPTPQRLGPRRGARYRAPGTLCKALRETGSGNPNTQPQSRASPPPLRRVQEIKAQRRHLLAPGCAVGQEPG